MTIKVELPVGQEQPTPAKADEVSTPPEQESETAQSAPESDDSEQNTSAASDTEETEVKQAAGEDEDEAESDEDAEESEDKPKSDAEKPKKKGGFQRRIDKLNAAKADAQREAEYWKQQALKNAGEPKKESEPVAKPHAASQDGKPHPDDYPTHAEYVEALTDWKTEQKFKERDQKAYNAKLESDRELAKKSLAERVKAFAEKTPDYDEVLDDVKDIRVSATLDQLLIHSESGPELIYELAKNRSEFERIAKLAPLAAAVEIGKIEARIAASKTSETKKPELKKTTQAPKPIAPLGAKGGKVEKSIYDAANMSQREYDALRDKQQRSARQ